MRLLVTATNPDGTATAASTATVAIPSAPPVNTVRPAITGTAQRGSTLTATTGTWTGIGNARPTSGSAPRRHQLAEHRSRNRHDVCTHRLRRGRDRPRARDDDQPGGQREPGQHRDRHRGGRRAGQHRRAGDLRHGSAHVHADVVAGHVERQRNTLAYQWQRSPDGSTWTDIAGATSAAYELTAADVGAKVRLLVSASNPDGTSSRATGATATVKAAPPVNARRADRHGRDPARHHLSASQGTWTGPGLTFAYQWQHDSGSGFTDIAGATGTTYPLGVADVGTSLRVRVTATNADADRHRHEPGLQHRAGAARRSAPARRRSRAPPGAPRR